MIRLVFLHSCCWVMSLQVARKPPRALQIIRVTAVVCTEWLMLRDAVPASSRWHA